MHVNRWAYFPVKSTHCNNFLQKEGGLIFEGGPIFRDCSNGHAVKVKTLTKGYDDKGDPPNVLHLSVELKVALPPKDLVTPLYHPAEEGYHTLHSCNLYPVGIKYR